MKRQSIYFSGPRGVEVREESLVEPGPGQVLVQTEISAISPGTEMLFYRGQVAPEMDLDASIPALAGTMSYPFKYGYACIGTVTRLGMGVDAGWLGRRVFSFHPHESLFTAGPDELMPLPEGMAAEDAVFLPNMETAVNFVQDGKPVLGETVAVLGLGVVGLLTIALLAQFPLERLTRFDRFELRRKAAWQLDPGAVFNPDEPMATTAAMEGLADRYDLVYELTGSPAALNSAIELAGFNGRVVIGSWYGSKPVQLNLGGRFHRSRIRLIDSQVSSLAPDLMGRWNKERRFAVAWRQIARIRPSRWVTQRFPIEQAEQAYRCIDERPQDSIQVILDYGTSRKAATGISSGETFELRS